MEHCMSDIIDTAVANGNFKTLATAVGAAGLVETLKGAGPFTVFAPTDAAFAKLPAGTLESLTKPENKAKLSNILTYHVLSGKVLAADAKKMTSGKTVQGQSVRIESKDGGVHIDGALVTTADILCDNGVIHVIDTVMQPK
jgi:transforming growth factor-beta-induced protein